MSRLETRGTRDGETSRSNLLSDAMQQYYYATRLLLRPKARFEILLSRKESIMERDQLIERIFLSL